MLHHTIGNNWALSSADPWTDTYIFPGGIAPSLAQIVGATEKRFIIEDVQNFGPDYDKTLMAWYDNFRTGYPGLGGAYDEKFYRMWEFYLLLCAGAFRARNLELYQIVMRRIEPSGTYVATR